MNDFSRNLEEEENMIKTVLLAFLYASVLSGTVRPRLSKRIQVKPDFYRRICSPLSPYEANSNHLSSFSKIVCVFVDYDLWVVNYFISR